MTHEANLATSPMVVDPHTGQAQPSSGATLDTWHHGLRIKVGLDCGKLKGEINCITGRMVRKILIC